MACTCSIAARKDETSSAAAMRQRWEHELAIVIHRERGAMGRSCLPRVDAKQSWLALGFANAGVPRTRPRSAQANLPPLENEERRFGAEPERSGRRLGLPHAAPQELQAVCDQVAGGWVPESRRRQSIN